MRKDFLQYLSHEFAQFKLEKQGDKWQLNGRQHSLSPLGMSVLVQLVEEKGYVVDVKNLVKSISTTPERILVNICKALGATYVKANSRCEFIETAHGKGSRWIFEPVISRGFSCLEIRPIDASSPELKPALLFLLSSFASQIREVLNITVHTTPHPTNTSPNSCFVIDGKCLSFEGTYRLILELSCEKLADGHRSFKVETNNLFSFVDEPTEWVLDTLKTLLPETIR